MTPTPMRRKGRMQDRPPSMANMHHRRRLCRSAGRLSTARLSRRLPGGWLPGAVRRARAGLRSAHRSALCAGRLRPGAYQATPNGGGLDAGQPIAGHDGGYEGDFAEAPPRKRRGLLVAGALVCAVADRWRLGVRLQDLRTERQAHRRAADRRQGQYAGQGRARRSAGQAVREHQQEGPGQAG